MIYLGIDTSNYKTSLAAVDEGGRILASITELLDVPKGKRGLRQSEAFFIHSNKLPLLLNNLLDIVNVKDLVSIGVSARPRRLKESYMPCFLAGINMAKTLSECLNLPLYEFSHQEGHAAAIICEDDINCDKPFIFMHLSGGTTEFLKCSIDELGYSMDIIGGTLDISIGQLLDRFGVATGMPFPSGKYLDEAAYLYKDNKLPGVLPKISVNNGYFNLSGAETKLLKYAKSDNLSNKSISAISYEIFDKISDIIITASKKYYQKTGIDTVYISGGVASSKTLRSIMETKTVNDNIKYVFGDNDLSGDNAVGIAKLARRLSREDQ